MITPLPQPPSTANPSTFDGLADAFIAAMPIMVTEINDALIVVADSTDTCVESATNASLASSAAINITTASKWVSGTYSIGAVAWSPINGLSYRAKTTGSKPTDPSLDPTNWFTLGATADVLADLITLERVAVSTLQNKTINLSNNTITGTLAQLNAAISDTNVVSLDGVETLTNKTIVSPIISSPTLSGVPTSTTASIGTNSYQVATTAYVKAEIAEELRKFTDQVMAISLIFKG